MSKTLKLIDNAIEALENISSPELIGISRSQIKNAIDDLHVMRDNVINNKLPPRSRRDSGLGKAVADSWPFNNQAAEKVMAAVNAYLEA